MMFLREKQFSHFVEQELFPWIAPFPIEYLEGNAQQKIAYRYLHHPQHTKLMILVNGRAENIVKWSEIAYDFYHQGFDVLLFDHRGQGFSSRLLANRQKGYIDQFRYYIDDMDLVVQHILQKKNYQQQVLFAHSMGALLTLHYLTSYPHNIDKVILSSPFMGLPDKTSKRNEIIVMLMVLLGFSGSYVFTKGPYKPADISKTELTHSKARLDFVNQVIEQYPDVCLGGPTFAWVHRMVIALKKLPKLINRIQLPMLILQAGEEKIVSTSQVSKICTHSPFIQIVDIANAKHEIMFETDEIRSIAFKQIIHFLN